MNQPKKEMLQSVLLDLNKAKDYLQLSAKKCESFGLKTSFSPEELESLEALTARFARLIDILFKRAYRTILFFELEESGTYLDLLNKAAKRGLIDSESEMSYLKDIRNLIAHEYANRNFDIIIKEVLKFTPIVLILVDKINKYCEPLLTQTKI